MNVNPDPRPGRWLLPLVVLGMVAFTYVFVNQLPGDGADTTDTTEDVGAAGSTSSTTIPDGSNPQTTVANGDDTTATTAPPASPEVAAYKEAMEALATELTSLQAELSSANSAWEDGSSSYSDAQAAFTNVSQNVAEWRDRVAAVSVPSGMTETQNTLVEAANAAANQAAAALDGLVNSSGPDKRRNSVIRFDEAVSAFTQTVNSI
jgi:exonuclease VII small subunit